MHLQCHLISAIIKRPIAIWSCFRLAPRNAMQHWPHTCSGGRVGMADLRPEAVCSFLRPLDATLEEVLNFQTVTLAAGFLAQLV